MVHQDAVPSSSSLLDDLQWRGLVHQCTDLAGLQSRLAQSPITLYCGFDPTANSLHVGNLIPLISLARFQRAGHRALALVGGATGLIGDPSGKSAERALQSEVQVEQRTQYIERQIQDVLQRLCGAPATVVNNIAWTQDVRMLEFLRDVGKHFSVNAMIQRDSVRSRLDREGEGISFTEFSYMLLQAFDFLCLHESENCVLQIGGSDQWGNMVSGADLIRRKHAAQAFALTFPLLTNSDGQKFGKSVNGAVWLDPELTSPWEFYQFWVNAADADVLRLLQLFTFVPRRDIEALAQQLRDEPHLRAAQKRLAAEMTRMIHGADALGQVLDAIEVVFGKGSAEGLSLHTLRALSRSLPCVEVAESGLKLSQLLVKCGLEPSMTRANEAIRQGGVSLNNIRQDDAQSVPDEACWLHGKYLLLKKGKKSFALAVRTTAAA